jgi:glycosyltransferase involved in cell wall biosynthesis
MRATLGNASIVVTVSEASRKALQRHSLIEPQRIRTIHPGVDDRFHRPCTPAEKREVREKYSLPEYYVLHVGNIEPRKNLRALLRACQLLRERGFPYALVMVGKRRWKSRRIIAEAHARGFGQEVVLTGYVEREHLPAIYQSSALYVCSSLYEGFGFPPLEAMASGIPVVSSNRGALGETLGQAAYTVDPTDPKALASAAALMLSNANIREEHVRRGLERARTFDWKESAAQMLEIYRKVGT